jgi:hypothetical protein
MLIVLHLFPPTDPNHALFPVYSMLLQVESDAGGVLLPVKYATGCRAAVRCIHPSTTHGIYCTVLSLSLSRSLSRSRSRSRSRSHPLSHSPFASIQARSMVFSVPPATLKIVHSTHSAPKRL